MLSRNEAQDNTAHVQAGEVALLGDNRSLDGRADLQA